MQKEGECAVVARQGHLIAVVTFLIGCTILPLVVGCAGTSSETSKKEQEPTEATKKEQTRSPEATASDEARCEGTRKANVNLRARYTTNDLPGCPKGGLLKGTDGPDSLAGEDGDDEIRGLGGRDDIFGGSGNDIIYGGDGEDYLETQDQILEGPYGEDALYGGDGSDQFYARDGQQDEIYCGEGRDEYDTDKDDYVASSCEKKTRFPGEA